MNNKEKVSWDIGTKTFIYNVPQLPLWGEISFQDKKWHKAEADLLPLIVRVLEAMREKEEFLNTTLDDLEITGMNFGWEVPGTFDASVRVKNISLKFLKKLNEYSVRYAWKNFPAEANLVNSEGLVEVDWKIKPEYQLPVFSRNNTFEQLITDPRLLDTY